VYYCIDVFLAEGRVIEPNQITVIADYGRITRLEMYVGAALTHDRVQQRLQVHE
jgi:hypothetical protein